MKLRFEPDLPHQRSVLEAVVAAVDATSIEGGGMRVDEAGVVAYANPTGLPERLAVEMETGTGKTYAFLRTALELASRFETKKFIIVVPSVAIREGVLATLAATREHFRALYPALSVRFFEHRRDRLSRLRQFVRSTTVEFMVVTIDAFTKDTNVLRRPADAFGGHAPLLALGATRPVVIVDEPHRMQTALRTEALADLRPSLLLAFGATLGAWPGPIVHRLTPAEAHRRGLVKSIVVHGREQADAYAAQIRDTVATHLRRAVALRPRGIKVLSLFFLDRVAAYVDADGLARALFDDAFEALKHSAEGFESLPASAVRSAYFATRSGRAVDSKTGRSAADAEAYALILADKPRLLSFEEPVSFVFSHSALREGWDNPNVFQICTLGSSQSAIRKRQEIGRGVRLCVDQRGRRVTDPAVNVLEVFGNESYTSFVEGLQQDDQPDAQRAPAPGRRVARASTGTGEPKPWPSEAELVERAAGLLRAFEGAPSTSSHSTIEHAVARLARSRIPMRRGAVLAAMEASGRGDALAADPIRAGVAIADAFVQARG